MEVRSTRWEVNEQRRAVRRQLRGPASRQAPGGSARDSETQCCFLTITRSLTEQRRTKLETGQLPTGKDPDCRPLEASARREGKGSVWGWRGEVRPFIEE